MNYLFIILLSLLSVGAYILAIGENALNLKNIKEYLKKNIFVSSILVFTTLGLAGLSGFFLLNNDFSIYQSLFFLIVFSVIVYLLIYDGFYFVIPSFITYIFCGLGVIAFASNYLFETVIFPTSDLAVYPITSLNQLLAGLIYAFLYLFLWFITNKKGMGDGDMFIAFGTGLLLGGTRTLLAFYYTIFIALIFSLLVILKQRKLKGVKIPYVPFMGVGFLLATIAPVEPLLNLLFNSTLL